MNIREILHDYSLQQIEEQIIHYRNCPLNVESETITSFMQMRKDIINHNVLQHQEEILPDIIAYNDEVPFR